MSIQRTAVWRKAGGQFRYGPLVQSMHSQLGLRKKPCYPKTNAQSKQLTKWFVNSLHETTRGMTRVNKKPCSHGRTCFSFDGTWKGAWFHLPLSFWKIGHTTNCIIGAWLHKLPQGSPKWLLSLGPCHHDKQLIQMKRQLIPWIGQNCQILKGQQ